ncbi:MAG: transketolase [Thermoguttaceae bacterium]
MVSGEWRVVSGEGPALWPVSDRATPPTEGLPAAGSGDPCRTCFAHHPKSPNPQIPKSPSGEGTGASEARLEAKSRQIRREVLAVCVRNGAGHIAPSLSCLEILVALYYDVMRYRPREPQWADRDRLIVSKAHGAYALYAILADLGVIPRPQWENFYTPQSSLAGCVERKLAFGLEAGCGSLGHGLPIAVGVALGAKLTGAGYHTFCLAGDGELQEGTTWEAIQFAVKHRLGNLTIIVDRNRLQAMDFIRNVMDRDEADLPRRLAGFGLRPAECPGHDPAGLARRLRALRNGRADHPGLLLADTVKGFGLKCMEGVPRFHFRVPTPEELGADKGTGTFFGPEGTEK